MYNFDVLSKWASEKPDEIAFADEMHEITFAQLNIHVRKTANVLAQSGISRGDFVCTVLPSYFGWVFTLALHLLGATTITRNKITPFDYELMPKWIIAHRLHPQIPADRTVIFNQELFERIINSPEILVAPGYKNPADPARVFSTSGTSGLSKNIMLTIEELGALPLQSSSYDFVGQDHVMSLYPFGARQSYRRALKCLTVGKAFYACAASDYRLMDFLRKYPIRTLLGSPIQVSELLDIQQQTGSELTELATIILGGTKPSRQLIDRIGKQLGSRVYDAYGSTEGSYVAMRDVTTDFPEGSTINPEVTVEIVDEGNVPLENNAIGRVRYKRPGMATKYYKNPKASAEFFQEGFFYPGDLGFINAQGQLVLAGRANEVINLGGVKINPEKVEEVALAQLGVSDCACYSVIGVAGVEELAIALVTDEDFDLEIFKKTMAKKSLSLPSQFIQVDAIPRNENGKILRSQLSSATPRSQG